MKKAAITALLCLFLSSAFSGAAFAQELVVGGQVVGIQISTEGVMVAGVAEVETAGGSSSPASDAGLKRSRERERSLRPWAKSRGQAWS